MAATSPFKLMAHQEEGIRFLLERQSGLLAFEQGLGKTLVAIAAFDKLRSRGAVETMLVVCPNSLKRNWAAEVARFNPAMSVEIIAGRPRDRRAALVRTRAAVVMVSYETARGEVPAVLALLARVRAVLVLDESHAVKNRASLTSVAAQHFAPRCAYRWLLSGTPVTNTAADLYTQVGIIAAGSPLGTFESFVSSFSDPRRAEALRERVAPYVLRRTKAECLDLPEKTFTDILVELPAWQRSLYDSMRDELVCEVESMTGEQFRAFAPTALSRLLRLSQLASNPGLLLPTEPRVPIKFEELDHLVEEIVRGSGEKLIVWSHYVRTIEALIARYADLKPVALYGGTPAEDRQAIAESFQTDPSVKLMVANPAAAGTGFTLTAACYAVYETLSWRYDFFAQSQDRIHRIGQGRPVTYLRLIAADTVEELIAAALERKAELARALLGDPAGAVAIWRLTPGEFCAMLVRNELPQA